jgi:uncharacterized protein YfaP (DUF2135 family)
MVTSGYSRDIHGILRDMNGNNRNEEWIINGILMKYYSDVDGML